jgi:hypothetical protein
MDVEYLTAIVRNDFKLASSDSIVLQRYEDDWIKDYMDIDGDAVIEHREKLKVLVVSTAATVSTSTELPAEVSLIYFLIGTGFYVRYGYRLWLEQAVENSGADGCLWLGEVKVRL